MVANSRYRRQDVLCVTGCQCTCPVGNRSRGSSQGGLDHICGSRHLPFWTRRFPHLLPVVQAETTSTFVLGSHFWQTRRFKAEQLDWKVSHLSSPHLNVHSIRLKLGRCPATMGPSQRGGRRRRDIRCCTLLAPRISEVCLIDLNHRRWKEKSLTGRIDTGTCGNNIMSHSSVHSMCA